MKLKYNNPDWKPLENLVFKFTNSINIEDFMYMGSVDLNKQWFPTITVHLYKHRNTRAYLNVSFGDNDKRPKCWKYEAVEGEYKRISTEEAMREAVSDAESWEAESIIEAEKMEAGKVWKENIKNDGLLRAVLGYDKKREADNV